MEVASVPSVAKAWIVWFPWLRGPTVALKELPPPEAAASQAPLVPSTW